MKVKDLIAQLNEIEDKDTDAKIALYLGPGTPSARLYSIVGLRKMSIKRNKLEAWLDCDVYDLQEKR